MAWYWTFVATLGATEWFITAVFSFMSLQSAWRWTYCVTVGAAEWFITGGFFHVFFNGLILNIRSHTRSNLMVFQWCELFHVSLHCLMLRNGSNWRVYHLSGFFLVQVQNPFVCFVFYVENWTDRYIFQVLFLIMTQMYQSFHRLFRKNYHKTACPVLQFKHLDILIWIYSHI